VRAGEAVPHNRRRRVADANCEETAHRQQLRDAACTSCPALTAAPKPDVQPKRRGAADE
jgi:hypothetical protein